jgi:hypothetical protein
MPLTLVALVSACQRKVGLSLLMLFCGATLLASGCSKSDTTVVTPAGGPYVPTEMEQKMLDSVPIPGED